MSKLQKGTFFLNHERMEIPTNNTMYDCADCIKNGIEHKIEDKPEPDYMKGPFSLSYLDAGTIRVCSGCGKYDGPWVIAQC